MIRKLNGGITINALEDRLAKELEEKTELGCYPIIIEPHEPHYYYHSC